MIGRPRPEVTAATGYVPGKAKEAVQLATGVADVLKLASNERTAPPSERVAAAMAAAAKATNRYPDHRAVSLRNALAAELSTASGTTVGIESVAVSAGSSSLLMQLTSAYAGPGREVVYPWPSFEYYPILADLSGAKSNVVPLQPDWGFDIDGLIGAVTPATTLMFVATPNNPTGTAIAKSDLNRLLEAVPDDIIVVVDEAYREYVVPDLWDPVDLVTAHPNVVHLRTFSKAHALASARVGWCLAHPEVIECIHATQTPFAVTTMALAGAEASLGELEALKDHTGQTISERQRIVAALQSLGWTPPQSQEGNFVFLPTNDATGLAGALETSGIIVRPFADTGIRATVGEPHENDRFLDALSRLSPLSPVAP
ncbi:MAG: aminotransferase class I/II-fold pyridoxal phosphate-dependent enzyme [Actinobacteria bacterium]|nr:aminotransferase class I/II-fold pyridoxal phosphate-dependent enzyme [Actinomycetota bacterium]